MSRILNIFSYKLGRPFARTSNPEDAKRIPGGKLSLSVPSKPAGMLGETPAQAEARRRRDLDIKTNQAGVEKFEESRTLSNIYDKIEPALPEMAASYAPPSLSKNYYLIMADSLGKGEITDGRKRAIACFIVPRADAFKASSIERGLEGRIEGLTRDIIGGVEPKNLVPTAQAKLKKYRKEEYKKVRDLNDPKNDPRDSKYEPSESTRAAGLGNNTKISVILKDGYNDKLLAAWQNACGTAIKVAHAALKEDERAREVGVTQFIGFMSEVSEQEELEAIIKGYDPDRPESGSALRNKRAARAAVIKTTRELFDMEEEEEKSFLAEYKIQEEKGRTAVGDGSIKQFIDARRALLYRQQNERTHAEEEAGETSFDYNQKSVKKNNIEQALQKQRRELINLETNKANIEETVKRLKERLKPINEARAQAIRALHPAEAAELDALKLEYVELTTSVSSELGKTPLIEENIIRLRNKISDLGEKNNEYSRKKKNLIDDLNEKAARLKDTLDTEKIAKKIDEQNGEEVTPVILVTEKERNSYLNILADILGMSDLYKYDPAGRDVKQAIVDIKLWTPGDLYKLKRTEKKGWIKTFKWMAELIDSVNYYEIQRQNAIKRTKDEIEEYEQTKEQTRRLIYEKMRLRESLTPDEIKKKSIELRKKILRLDTFLKNCTAPDFEKRIGFAAMESQTELEKAQGRLEDKNKEIESAKRKISADEGELSAVAQDMIGISQGQRETEDRLAKRNKYELLKLALDAAVYIETDKANAAPELDKTTEKLIKGALVELDQLKTKGELANDNKLREFCERFEIMKPEIVRILAIPASQAETRYLNLKRALSSLKNYSLAVVKEGGGHALPPEDWEYIGLGVPVVLEKSAKALMLPPKKEFELHAPLGEARKTTSAKQKSATPLDAIIRARVAGGLGEDPEEDYVKSGDEAELLAAEANIKVLEGAIEDAGDIDDAISTGAEKAELARDQRRIAFKTKGDEEKNAQVQEKGLEKESRLAFSEASETINKYIKYLELNQFVNIFNDVLMPNILMGVKHRLSRSRINDKIAENRLLRSSENKNKIDEAIRGLEAERAKKEKEYKNYAALKKDELLLLVKSFEEEIDLPYILRVTPAAPKQKETPEDLKIRNLKWGLTKPFKSLITSAKELAETNTSEESAMGESSTKYAPIMRELKKATDALNGLLEDIGLDPITSSLGARAISSTKSEDVAEYIDLLEDLEDADKDIFNSEEDVSDYFNFLKIDAGTSEIIDLVGGVFKLATSAIYDEEPGSAVAIKQIEELKIELDLIELAFNDLSINVVSFFILPTTPMMEVEELKTLLDKQYFIESVEKKPKAASDLEISFQPKLLNYINAEGENIVLDRYVTLLRLRRNLRILTSYVSYGRLGEAYFTMLDLIPEKPIDLKRKLSSARDISALSYVEAEAERYVTTAKAKTKGSEAGAQYVIKTDKNNRLSEIYLKKLMENVILNPDVDPETNLYKFTVSLILKEIIQSLYNIAKAFMRREGTSFNFVPELGAGGTGAWSVVMDAAYDAFGREPWIDEETGKNPLIMRSHLAYKKDKDSETGYTKETPERIKGFKFSSQSTTSPNKESIIGYVSGAIRNRLLQLREKANPQLRGTETTAKVVEKTIAPGSRKGKVSYVETKVKDVKEKIRDFDEDLRLGVNLGEIYNILAKYVVFDKEKIQEKNREYTIGSKYIHDKKGELILNPNYKVQMTSGGTTRTEPLIIEGRYVYLGGTPEEQAASKKGLDRAKEKYKYLRVRGWTLGEELPEAEIDTDIYVGGDESSPQDIRSAEKYIGEWESAVAETDTGIAILEGEDLKVEEEKKETERDEQIKVYNETVEEILTQKYKGKKLGALAHKIFELRARDRLTTKEIAAMADLAELAAAAGVKFNEQQVARFFDDFIAILDPLIKKKNKKALRSKAEVEADLVSRTAPKPKNLFDLKAKDAPSDDRSTQVPEGIKIYLVPTDKNAESLDIFNAHIATLQEQLEEGAPLELCESMIDFLEFLAQAIRAAYTNTKTGELDIRVSDILDKINEYREALENIEAQKPITSADMRKSLNREVLRLLGSPQITSTNTSNDIKYLSDILYRVIVYPVTEDPFRGDTLGRLLYHQGATPSNRVKVAPGVVSERMKNPGGPKTKINMLGFLKARLDSVTPFIRS